MTTENLTPEQKMQLAIAKAKEARKIAKDEAKLELINNADYVGYLASIEDEADQIKSLQAIIDAANKMKAIVTADGTKYGVNIYPVAEYLFGPVAGRVLGLITGSSAMFTDERQAEFNALTKVPYLAFSKASSSIGSPAYFSKGNFVEAMPGNGDCRKSAILAILQGLDIDIEYVNQLTAEKLDKWFAVSEAKAQTKATEYKKIELIDNSQSFKLED